MGDAPPAAGRHQRSVTTSLRSGLLAVAVGVGALLLASAFGRWGAYRSVGRTASRPTGALPAVVRGDASPASSSAAAIALGRAPRGSLDATIASLRERTERLPRDHVALATLGIAYVQQAASSADPSALPVAETVLRRALDVGGDDAFLADAGLAALANARHRFDEARRWAEAGLRIAPRNALLLGALADAQTQLGEYGAAERTVQQMLDRSPDAASFSRASYARELRGDVVGARALMQRAVDDAPDAPTAAFAHTHLGDLAFDSGSPEEALRHQRAALAAVPGLPNALAGKARAEAALGQPLTALDDWAALLERVPDPGHLAEMADLLDSLGRADDAREQRALIDASRSLQRASGIAPDPASILYEADHGDPAMAVAEAAEVLRTRPFVAMWDAYAWALHRAGRDVEALPAARRALSTGVRSAPYRYHLALIELAVGDRAGAMGDLATALSVNPEFDPLAAPAAVALLAELRDGR